MSASACQIPAKFERVRSCAVCAGVLLMSALALTVPRLRADDRASFWVKTMAARARQVTIEMPGSAGKPQLIDEPIYRFNDAARNFPDGTIWAFGKTGRPVALLTFSVQKTGNGRLQWLYEFASLAPGPLRATRTDQAGATVWAPAAAGLEWKPLPHGPAPAKDAGKRTRQLKDLARRFRAHEFWDVNGTATLQRYELRLLTQPVHRYSDPKAGVIDGGLFIIAYGQNPEMVLLIEARESTGGEPAWFYGLGRISSARNLILLDDHEVADFPLLRNAGTQNAYGSFAVPMTETEP